MGIPLPLTVLVLLCAVTARAETVQTRAGDVNVEKLAQLEHPWALKFLPDGKLLITEKPGRLRVFENGKLAEAISGVPKVAFREQGGLLDIAIDPNFATSRTIYLSFSEPADPQPPDAKDQPDHRLGVGFKAQDNVLKGGAVASATLSDDCTKLTDVKVIWRQEPKTVGRGHYGGRVVVSPDGGKLFITSGERQRFEPAQDPNTNLGKIVRINADGSIPQDNPFVNKPGHRPDMWTIGNRNPLGLAFHPVTGKLWEDEMGPKGGDELNLVEPGKNYGWPDVSEGVHYDDTPIPKHATRSEFAPPVRQWTPVISPAGLIFYTGTMFTKWKLNAFIGGLSSQALVRVEFDGDKAVSDEKIKMNRRIRDVCQAPDGAILLLSDGPKGELLRITPGATQ
jgi:glucose/arabinose dehydrogenase